MDIKNTIEGKKQWKAHIKRIKEMPKDYQIVYKEMQKYIYKVGSTNTELLYEIGDLFEEGVLRGKSVLEVTGNDVATFCQDLIQATNEN